MRYTQVIKVQKAYRRDSHLQDIVPSNCTELSHQVAAVYKITGSVQQLQRTSGQSHPARVYSHEAMHQAILQSQMGLVSV